MKLTAMTGTVATIPQERITGITDEDSVRGMRLQAQSGRDAETDLARWEGGFVFTHRSDHAAADESFLEIMECIRVLAPEIAASQTVSGCVVPRRVRSLVVWGSRSDDT